MDVCSKRKRIKKNHLNETKSDYGFWIDKNIFFYDYNKEIGNGYDDENDDHDHDHHNDHHHHHDQYQHAFHPCIHQV